ncbi:hypothetical protein NQ317_014704 [Molorchus minor]|uniref:Uncharacterized protein n=1 Tax=Molorchus minor TaxID=1323400 RepID=A0ABQ9JYY4_9CUCU|nr:hypothetical protein NQ317_014704 [Molorchus minor]
MVSPVTKKTLENVNFDVDKGLVDIFERKYQKSNELRDDAGITAVVNEFADKIFANIHSYAVLHELDPIALANVSQEFLTASLTLTNGSLHGMSNINRTKDVEITYRSAARECEIYFPIRLSKLQFTYDYHMIILLIGPQGVITGKINNFEMDVKLHFDFKTYHAKVLEVSTKNSGHVDLYFDGNGILDLVVDILSEFVTTILHPLIALVIEGNIKDVANLVVNVVNEAIDNTLFPNSSTLLIL